MNELPLDISLLMEVSSDHVYIFASIPPHVRKSDLIKARKGSFRKMFPQLRKKYWGRHFWARGYFSVTSGNVTDDMIQEYINHHLDAHKKIHADNLFSDRDLLSVVVESLLIL